jgi:hypothetical protein
VYVSGQDSFGRAVVVFVASHLPAQNVDMEQVLLYIIHVLDPIVTNDYNLIYLHTNIKDVNKVPKPNPSTSNPSLIKHDVHIHTTFTSRAHSYHIHVTCV